MSLTAGSIVDLEIERPASGGRMIARHEGQVVLVLGAIPGERVRARVEKADRRLAFASTLEALTPSDDRRPAVGDPLCGGCVFSHIAYPRQVTIKAQIVADAFARIGKLSLSHAVPVTPSPEHGYRMRARFHVRGEQAGFFREGSHTLCDPGPTGQLLPESVSAVRDAVRLLLDAGVRPDAIELSENIAADERSMHIDVADSADDLESALDDLVSALPLRGATARTARGHVASAGEPVVSDPLALLTGGRAEGKLARSPESFFQANRHLLPALVGTVLDRVTAEGGVLDLYAGVGLFSIALGATGQARVVAVESDRSSVTDLKHNAVPWRGVRPHAGRVEDYLARHHGGPADVIIVDPPRTGISREAMDGIVRFGATTVIYVSCDPPTMARDARRLVDAGYTLEFLQAFDLFPNTPHVESVGVFQRGA